jgi:release factor glutamine methyltransferase
MFLTPAPANTWWRRAQRWVSRAGLRWRFRLLQRGRLDRVVVEEVAGRSIVVLPTVFNPRIFRSGAFFAESLAPALIPPGSSVLDLGTGSGVVGVVAATWAGWVVATDVNPEAVRCARINALLHHLDGRIEVRAGNLFDPVAGERFDVVLFNPPYYRGAPTTESDRAWRSEDDVERFARELASHLTPNGRSLVVLSTDGESEAFLASFQRAGLAVSAITSRQYANETFTMYALNARSV